MEQMALIHFYSAPFVDLRRSRNELFLRLINYSGAARTLLADFLWLLFYEQLYIFPDAAYFVVFVLFDICLSRCACIRLSVCVCLYLSVSLSVCLSA